MAGLWFDQFTVGQVFKHEIRKTVLDYENSLFSSLTYNPAQIHIDHAYCAGTEFGKPLMNSIFTLGLVIGLSVQETTLGTTVANYLVSTGPVRTWQAFTGQTTIQTAGLYTVNFQFDSFTCGGSTSIPSRPTRGR